MLITKISPLSNKENTLEIGIHPAIYKHWNSKDPQDRILIQDMFPDISSSEREFLLTGITPTEWDEHFGSEEE